MKICAVICEYNPFHTGHLYQLNEAAKKFDHTICIMSGNFVQRAEPAVAEKYVRAEIALRCGASMVLELPIVYATANGERFADGAIKTLKSLTDINAVVMGCETDDTDALITLADIQSREDDDFKALLAANLDNGLSYAAALSSATVTKAKEANISPDKAAEILTKPNNLLCIEYAKAIKRNGLDIKPVFIKRKGNDYNNISEIGNYLSASALRELIYKNDYTAAIPYLTGEYGILLEELKNHKPDKKTFSDLAVYKLRISSTDEIAKAFDCREGLEYRLSDAARSCITIEDVLLKTKTKRYTMSRLKRVILQVMLGITDEFYKNSSFLPPRLLAIKENFKPYLTENGKNMIIRTEDMLRYDGEYYERYFEVEKKAAALYSVITENKDDLFTPGKLICL